MCVFDVRSLPLRAHAAQLADLDRRGIDARFADLAASARVSARRRSDAGHVSARRAAVHAGVLCADVGSGA